MYVSFSITATLQPNTYIPHYEWFFISLYLKKMGLPADSRYKPGHQQGSPTERCIKAGQSTEDTKKKRRRKYS